MALAEQDSSPGELAELLGLKPSTITRFIDKLEKSELCKRKTEGKKVRVSISIKGNKLLNKIHQSWKKLFNDYNELYGEKEADKLNKLLV